MIKILIMHNYIVVPIRGLDDIIVQAQSCQINSVTFRRYNVTN